MVEVEGGTLTAVAGFDGHQGIALVVEPRTFAGLDDVLARAVERGEPPFVLVLDSLEDPQNVGTLLRSAEAAGVHGVLFPTHRQAPLSPAAIKASAGAVEHLLLCPVDDLPGALSDLRIRGLRIAAAEADAPLTAAQADLRGPLAIIVGSEGQGLSPVVRRRADLAVRIPMRGAIGSLNAAVAGSVLLFAAVAQRDPGGEGDALRAARPAFDEGTATAPPAEPGPGPGAGPDEPGDGAAKPGAAATEAAASTGTATPAASKHPRRPAPTTAAQKRARATSKTKAGEAAPPPDGSAEVAAEELAVELPAERRRPAARAAKGATSARAATASDAAIVPDSAVVPAEAAPGGDPPDPRPVKPRATRTRTAAAAPAEFGESTPATPARRRRATPPKPPADAPAEPSAEGDPTSDDLLPGGPPAGKRPRRGAADR